MLSNKKIMLVCKETYSWPMILIAEKLSKNNRVALFFGCPSECTFNEFELGYSSTYYYAKRNAFKWKIYDVKDISLEFVNNVKHSNVDYEYLDFLEKEYTHYKNINLQCMSAQELSRFAHYREIYGYATFEQRWYWLSLNYKRIIEIVDDFKPDMVLDINNETLQRTILSEICYKEKIPHINIEESKVGNLYFFSFSNTAELDKYFAEGYEEALKLSPEDMIEEYEYIKSFRDKTNIMDDRFKGTSNSQYKADSWFKVLRWMISAVHYEYQKDIKGKNGRLCRKNPVFFGSLKQQLSYWCGVQIRRRRLYKNNKYFEDPVEGEKYIYVPLHLIPESTTFVQAPMYVNELNNIEMLSKAIPAGWKIYVKEHQSMVGERDVEFYEKVKKIPNVRLVRFNYYDDPKPWIIKSQGVYTVTGTGAFEAALLGKRSIILGEMTCQVIDGIYKLDSFRNLNKALKEIASPIDNIHSCAAYIHTAKKYGVTFKVFTITLDGKKVLKEGKPITKEYEQELDDLIEFFERGYKIYKERNGYGVVK